MKRKILACLLAVATVVSGFGSVLTVSAAEQEVTETVIEKSTLGNPIAGFDENGQVEYAGDPSVLVDGDTVYCYVGQDTATGEGYWMLQWLCYSSNDMVNWTYEGSIMKNSDVSWAANDHEAWAAQVIKYKDKYYFYYTTEGSSAVGGGKCVGVAVSDSPTGPFVDIGEPLIRNTDTTEDVHTWEDIDPTAWVETDPETGEDHRILGWGNNRLFNCELNEDMISVKDQNGDGKITFRDDIYVGKMDGIELNVKEVTFGDAGGSHFYTEAPYYYRQQDADGNYFGKYYLFFATDWREQMAYATADTYEDFKNNNWTFGGVIMTPSATANTNHMAVFDFKGHSYFVYHNGMLPWGSGYRRVACVQEMTINDDGSIEPMEDTSTGISGTASQIVDSSKTPIAHEHWTNTINDSDYPYVNMAVNVSSEAQKEDAMWEIELGKSDSSNESYVSIQSYNKAGLYLQATADKDVVLSQDYQKADANGKTADSDSMTFRTLVGFNGSGVTFESVAYPGYYLTSVDGDLKLTDGTDADACSFEVAMAADVSAITVQKTSRSYEKGEKVDDSDIRVNVLYNDGTSKMITSGFTTNAATISTSTTGEKTLTVSYTEKGITANYDVTLTVFAPAADTPSDIGAVKDVPKKGATATVGKLKYKVTKSDGYNTNGTNGNVSVVGIKSSKTASVVIPATVKIDGYTFKVTAVAANAFKGKSKLKTITIGTNVKSIGKNAIKGINKKAVIKVSSSRYKAVKKLLTSKTGFKKTMTLKKIS